MFENGATIRGKPTLWLPLSTTPKTIGGKRTTARRMRQELGKLTYVKQPGKLPLLAAPISATKAQAASGQPGRVTLARLRKGRAAKSGRRMSVPLFVGIDKVKIDKRLSLTAIIEKQAGHLGAVFEKRLAGKDID